MAPKVVHVCAIQSDLTYSHTSALNEIVDKVRKLGEGGSSKLIYSVQWDYSADLLQY